MNPCLYLSVLAGTYGWLFRTQNVSVDAYRYFVFINSSVRGPFLPAHWPVWTPLCWCTGQRTGRYESLLADMEPFLLVHLPA
jgi:hypothetical protein